MIDPPAVARGPGGSAAAVGDSGPRGRRPVPSAAALLGGIDGALVAAWLEPAVAVASPGDLPDLAAAAVPAGPVAIATILDRLGDADAETSRALAALLGGAPDLADAARLAVGRGLCSRACQRLARLLEPRTDAPVAGTLAVLAMEPDTIGGAAASSMHRWAAAGGDRRIGESDLDRIARAWRLSRRSDLLLVAAMAVGRTPSLVRVDDPRPDGEGPVLSIALGSVLQRVGTSSQSGVADRIPGWLAVPALSRTAQRAMGERRPIADAARLFGACHRLELPAVRRGLAGVARPARGIPDAGRLGGLGSRATRGLVRYASRATLLPAVRERVLLDLALVEDAATAWRATGRLSLESPRRIGGGLVRIASTGAGPAVRVAARRLSELGGRGSLDRVLSRRGGDGVARAATRRLTDASSRADAGQSRAWRRAVRLEQLERDRDSVLTEWRSTLVGGDPDRLYLSGHSAGAHLAAMMLAHDWAAEGRPADIVKGVVAVSGVYELEPVTMLKVNSEIGLTADEAARNSLVANLPRPVCPILVAVGGGETPDWIRQSADFAKLCRERGLTTDYWEIGRENHFSICDRMGEARHPLVRAMLAQMGL